MKVVRLASLCAVGAAAVAIGGASAQPSERYGDLSPAWAPDGRRIAYFLATGPAGPAIFVRSMHGTLRRKVAGASGTGGPAWSPDGTDVAFVGRPGSIAVANIATQRVTQLTSGPDDRSPTWSPDGSQIAFTSRRGGTWDLYVMGADGRGLTRLTALPGDEVDPHWSPDGRFIAFAVREPAGTFDIQLLDTQTPGFRPVTRMRGNERNPVWSPSGQRLAFDADSSGFQRIYSVAADGAGLRRLTNSRGRVRDFDPSWSATGIVFVSTRAAATRNSVVVWIRANGTGARVLPASGCSIVGTSGSDRLAGTRNADVICALGGADVLRAVGPGDVLDGGAGSDRLIATVPGAHVVIGGPGDDRLFTRNGSRDVVVGGGGRDFAEVDRLDRPIGVELVSR